MLRAARLDGRRRNVDVAAVHVSKPRLKAAKKRPRGPVDGLLVRKSRADSAGESVSALKAEISTEIAMVIANCW